MKTQKNVFKLFNPLLILCVLLVFGIALSGCNDSDSDDDDSSTTETVEPTTWYMDADSDGYGDPHISIEAATQPDGYVADNTDCDDSSADIHPGATEISNDGIDQDCDGTDITWEITIFYKDADADGYSDETTEAATVQPDGYYEAEDLIATWGDCDDSNAAVNPGAVEICGDGIDNDCNGSTDCNDNACVDDASCNEDDTDSEIVITYPVVDTGQTSCYDDDGNEITCPEEGEDFYGQDAQYEGIQMSFQDNGDGTVTDNVTGLMWQQVPVDNGYSYDDAVAYCESLELSGYDDWRIPTTKELFSISNFSKGWPYLDTTYFHIAGNSVSKDEQYWTEKYVGWTVQGKSNAAFGVNHGTGHIKAYPAGASGPMGNYVRAVRGNAYGVNDFENNGDGTVTDHATGLMWSQADKGEGLLWADALAYAENSELAGYDDWRLPNVKELQSIVDYSYSPTATDPDAVGPAIDPIFDCTPIINEAGNDDYPYFWSSTSARFKAGTDFYYAWYVAFGMAVNPDGQDYHGAGAVRYDTKSLDGPAGEDAARAYNYVRLVRNVSSSSNIAVKRNWYLDADSDGYGDPDTSIQAQDQPDGYVSNNTDCDDTNANVNPGAAEACNDGIDNDCNGSTDCVDSACINETVCGGDGDSGDSDDDGLAYEPFIDSNIFDFAYGDRDAGERTIDSQYATTAYYNMDETGDGSGNMFGVNFADGRIKGYGAGQDKTFFVMYVRDNEPNIYGENNFRDNGDGTITDLATGLMWMQDDSGYGMEWQDALKYCEDLEYAGHTDWRLPDAKELQSIVDYTRMPDATDSTTPSTAGAAIDTDFFNITSFTNYNGNEDWGFFWSGTTHQSSNGNGGWAVYVAFGRALGNMGDGWVDVHGAGCQRSDPKIDDGTDYSEGHGPQGDAIYVYNYVRPVRYDETVTNPTYLVVDTNQSSYWNNRSEISAPSEGDDFYGQDAQYTANAPSYTDNGDGTITDNITGLMWQKSPDTNGDGNILADDKYSYDEAVANASACNTGGYTDWRLPTIKELYSLMQFSGEDISADTLGDSDSGMDMPVDDGGDMGGDVGAQPELDFEAGAGYLAGLGVTITAAELEALFGTPPPPTTQELAQELGITEAQAETLMNDYLGLADIGREMPDARPPV